MKGRPSILDARGDDATGDHATETSERPDFFADLNLDQVVEDVIAGHGRYGLHPRYYQPLKSVDAVVYRQEVCRDLEDEALLARLIEFSEAMSSVRADLAQSATMRNVHQGRRGVLEAAAVYVGSVTRLAEALTTPRTGSPGIASRGLLSMRDYLSTYVSSPEFVALREGVRTVREDLDRVRYQMEIGGSRIRIRGPDGEADYSADVLASFDRFKQGDTLGRRPIHAPGAELTHVESSILALVVRLYPATFASLAEFCDAHRDFVDDVVAAFDREFHFYAAYLEYIAPLRKAGLAFAYPTMSATSKRVDVVQAFDLALAYKLVHAGGEVVCNDVLLKGKERILVVTGPNQGGKTTFARMFGQLHYLASLGLPVPGTRARLFLFDQLFTHFDKEEDLSALVGKLEEELVRVHGILERATLRSIIILNEMFTSTTLDDAVFLGTRVLERIIAMDAVCVSVTFIDEFASLAPSTVSLMSTVAEDDATRRTFTIVRRPADGLAYAAAIAQRHRLGYASLKARLGS